MPRPWVSSTCVLRIASARVAAPLVSRASRFSALARASEPPTGFTPTAIPPNDPLRSCWTGGRGCASRLDERGIPALLASAAQQRVVVPEDPEAAAVAAALRGDVHHEGVGRFQRPRHRRQQRDVHDLERPLDEAQRPTLAQVVDAIGMARAGAEADRFGVAERAVVAQAGSLPVAPRVGVDPAQVVLAPAPFVLAHALGFRDAQQSLELLARARGISIRAEARMQSDLVAAPRDPADERAHPGMLEQEGSVAVAPIAVGEEVERAAQAVAFADVHQEVERVVRVQAAVAQQRAHAPCGQPRVAPANEVATELARDVDGTVLEGGPGN